MTQSNIPNSSICQIHSDLSKVRKASLVKVDGPHSSWSLKLKNWLRSELAACIFINLDEIEK